MKKMTKLLSLFLVLVTLVSLLSVCAGAEGNTVAPRAAQNDRQRAVVETAQSYFHRGLAIQYDSAGIGGQGRDGKNTYYANLRESSGFSPEEATVSDTKFSVCSAFCWEVYRDVLNVELSHYQLYKTAYIIRDAKAEDPDCVIRWTPDETYGRTKEEAIQEAWKLMQPGDIIVASKPDGTSGHAMMFVGDILGNGIDYIIHCAGGKYDPKTGKESAETKVKDFKTIFTSQATRGGAIKRENAYEYCFNLESGEGYSLAKQGKFVIMRPLAKYTEAEYPLTANAKARLATPGVNVDRQANVNKFGSVAPGEEITVTIKVENTKPEGTITVPVTEIIPENATLKEGSITGGGTVEGNTIKWSFDLDGYKTKTIKYTLIAGGQRGDRIRLEGGNVAGIRSNSIPVLVSGKGLSELQTLRLQGIGSQAARYSGKGLEGEKLAETIYKEMLGLNLDISSSVEYLEKLYDWKVMQGSGGNPIIVRKDSTPADFQAAADMMVPFFVGGRQYYAANCWERIMDIKFDYSLMPGDIILRNDTTSPIKKGSDRCYVYLGDNKIAYMEKDALTVGVANTVLESLFACNYFVTLRPAMIYDNMFDTIFTLPFSDVKTGDWYYSFVKDAYLDGIISGMNATTFAPNGKLTYGQALKLITLGIGKDDPVKSGLHWASGYLKLAKDEKWLSGNVNLDSEISRLQFCEIAAKAKNLTEQPASNPFKDTDNPYVLALVNAGVINGMSEDTFAPNAILNRAQISKIITLLATV